MNKAMLVFYFDRKGHSWVTRSVTCSCFPSATVVRMPFVAFGSGLVWLISVRSVTVQPLILSV